MDCLDFALTHGCRYDIDRFVSDCNWLWEGYEFYFPDISINTLLQYDSVCELLVAAYQTGHLRRKFMIELVLEWIPKRNEMMVAYTKMECDELPDDVIDYIICDYVVTPTATPNVTSSTVRS